MASRASSSALVLAVSSTPSTAGNRATSSALVLVARVIPRNGIIPDDPPRTMNAGPRAHGGAHVFKTGE